MENCPEGVKMCYGDKGYEEESGVKAEKSGANSEESRVSQAVEAFEQGYNCAQSVFGTYGDLFGLDRETSFRMSSAMGAGIGRMREVCGVVSSMALLAGLKEGNIDPGNEEAKAHIYQLTRNLADRFREEKGSIICRELLGIQEREESAAPSLRTKSYYQDRPCRALVERAAQLIEEFLL